MTAAGITTSAIVNDFMKESGKITLIRHEVNQGLGQSLIDGYVKSLEDAGIDYTAVMAGDNQMHPDALKVFAGSDHQ